MRRCVLFAAVLTLLLVGPACVWAQEAAGPVLYVSPRGHDNAPGTREAPLSLRGVCAKKDVVPGATIHLTAGRYPLEKKVEVRWKGTPENRITMRSAPGEWAVVDGRIDIAGGATYVTLRDFEITRTKDFNKKDPNWWNLPVRERPTYSGKGANLEFNMGGQLIIAYGCEGVQLVNLYVHDNISGGGFGLWNPARNMLVYGNLLIRNGWEDKGRGHGHGCYIQNGWPDDRFGDSVKTFRHNITAYNHSTGMKSYGSRPCIRSTHFFGNIYFCNGMLSWTNGSANYLAGCGRNYMDDIVLKDNFFYQPDSITGDVGGTVYLGWGRKDKRTCVFTGNHVFGGGSAAVTAFHWQSLTFTGNTIYDDKTHLNVRAEEERMKNWVWDENTYYDNGKPKPLNGPQGAASFEEWKTQTGFDAKSKWLPEKPKGVQTFLTPNEFDPNRAHIVVYNWDHRPAVDLDLANFLKKGDRFVIYDVLEYRGEPVAHGEYEGGTVSTEMRERKITGREFAALVLQRLGAEDETLWKLIQARGACRDLYNRGDAAAALKALEDAGLKATKLYSRVVTVSAMARRMKQAWQKKDYRETRRLADGILAAEPCEENRFRADAAGLIVELGRAAADHAKQGAAAQAKGRAVEAARHLRQALACDPNNGAARQGIEHLKKQAQLRFNIALNLRRDDPKRARLMLNDVMAQFDPGDALYERARVEAEKLGK